ncbi:MAG: hypothetical protein JWM77_3850 [Rhodospirillales bacterium]|jgi:hypothetical protein|nr:hypothetical protein [Rhodospirillales bacterium]
MRRLVIRYVCALALVALCGAQPAQAESCRFVGCQGDVGYIFAPLPAQHGGTTIKFNSKDYPLKTPLFGKPGLPDVNAIVTTGRETQLFTEAAITTSIAAFKPLAIRDAATGEPDLTGEEPETGSELPAGSQIRILSWRTFSKPSGEQLLFALVQVVRH